MAGAVLGAWRNCPAPRCTGPDAGPAPPGTRGRSGDWAHEYLAPVFASRALAADDDHGRGAGIVTQADGLRWDELYAWAAVTGRCSTGNVTPVRGRGIREVRRDVAGDE